MLRLSTLRLARLCATVLTLGLLAGCAIAPPRTDDPLEHFNRKVYTFNNDLDKAVIRPVAVGYRHVTTPPIRDSISNFYTNIRLPITVVNDLLQARPGKAAVATGRFVVNLTIGFVGFMDPASQLGMPLEQTDFGITLARWGVPSGDFLMLPLVGPTTMRDVWRLPVDSYFDPLSIYPRDHHFKQGRYYAPQLLYLVSLRSHLIDAEGFLNSAYDPYVFLRDAYLQQRIYALYDGNPPDAVIERLQGLDQKGFDPDELLRQQQEWQKSHPKQVKAAGGF